jgi:hypothetical protein
MNIVRWYPHWSKTELEPTNIRNICLLAGQDRCQIRVPAVPQTNYQEEKT